MKMPLKQFLDLYIGGDWKDECVIVDAAEHEPVETFDGSEVVDAVWIDFDFDCGKVVAKLFIEVSLDDVDVEPAPSVGPVIDVVGDVSVKQALLEVKEKILAHFPNSPSVKKTIEREFEQWI